MRPLHVAHADWRAISNELRTRALLAAPKRSRFDALAAKAVEEIEVLEQVTRRTTVASKWIFWEVQ